MTGWRALALMVHLSLRRVILERRAEIMSADATLLQET